MPRPLRDALVSLSLANLCFLFIWLKLLYPRHYVYYNWEHYPNYIEFKALAVAIVSLAAVFWLGAFLAYRLQREAVSRIARIVFLATLTWPINGFIHDYWNIPVSGLLLGRWWIFALGLIVGGVVLFVVFRYPHQVVRVALTVLLILSPLTVVNFVSAIWLWSKESPRLEEYQAKRPSALVQTRLDAPRIVWIIFDELDSSFLPGKRPANLQLPEFDRFRGHSVNAQNAYSPSGRTLESMPALFSGQMVKEAKPLKGNELALVTEEGIESYWSTQGNVFSDARREGFSAGLAGWFHPYCRVIGDSLDWCKSVPIVDETNPLSGEITVSRLVWFWTGRAMLRIPFMFRLYRTQHDRKGWEDHIYVYQRSAQDAESLLRQDLNLRLFHLPIPHEPGIYNSRNHTLSDDMSSTYWDNLVLADRTLGKFRESLEQNGSWESSIVLVTSDHWWRNAPLQNGRQDHRVPYMLKLAGQKSGVEYERPFNTILTRQLLLQLLKGNLNSSDDVVAWIDGNARVSESPFTGSTP